MSIAEKQGGTEAYGYNAWIDMGDGITVLSKLAICIRKNLVANYTWGFVNRGL